MDGALEIGGAPPAQFEIAGTLDDTGLALDPLLVRALGGRATGRGRITMRPAISWEFEVDAHGIDPGRDLAAVGGTLMGNAVVEGGVVNDGAAHTTVQVLRPPGPAQGLPGRRTGCGGACRRPGRMPAAFLCVGETTVWRSKGFTATTRICRFLLRPAI